jgi:3-phenylpropionate/trans-cinnamate dioxygenase ferredoxin reductase subunit
MFFHVDASGRLVAASGIGVGASVARYIRIAERMVEARMHPPADQLADPTLNLKEILRGAESVGTG